MSSERSIARKSIEQYGELNELTQTQWHLTPYCWSNLYELLFHFRVCQSFGSHYGQLSGKINNKSINKPNACRKTNKTFDFHIQQGHQTTKWLLLFRRDQNTKSVHSLRTCGLFSLKDVRSCCIKWNGQLIIWVIYSERIKAFGITLNAWIEMKFYTSSRFCLFASVPFMAFQTDEPTDGWTS